MYISKYMLLENKTKINSALINYKKSKNYAEFLSRINIFIKDITLAARELHSLFKNETSSYQNIILLIEDYRINLSHYDEYYMEEIIDDTENLIAKIDYQLQNAPDHYVYNDYKHCKDISNEVIEKLQQMIVNKNHAFNALGIDVVDGSSLKLIKTTMPNANTFSICADSYRVEDIRENVDRAIFGTGYGMKVSQNAFDVLLLRPTLDLTVADDKVLFATTKRSEKLLIKNSFKYLKTDGIFCLSLPYFRFYNDLRVMLSKTLRDVTIFRDIFDQSIIHLIGVKKGDMLLDEETELKLRSFNSLEDLPFIHEINKTYTLPNDVTKVEFFRGSAITFEDIELTSKESSLFENMLEKDLDQTNHDLNKRPLLPFDIGQIGLVLTSGCLDGIVEEEDGSCHLIKGRVLKQYDTSTERDEIEQQATRVEVISNKVEITVLLPDGQYKVLA